MNNYHLLDSSVCLNNRHTFVEKHLQNALRLHEENYKNIINNIKDKYKDNKFFIVANIEDDILNIQFYLESKNEFNKEIDCVTVWNRQEIYVAGLYNDYSFLWLLDSRMHDEYNNKINVNHIPMYTTDISIDNLPLVKTLSVFY